MNEDELAERLESETSSGTSRPAFGSQADEHVARLRDLLSDEATWLDPAGEGADALLAAIQAESRPSDSRAVEASGAVVVPVATVARKRTRPLVFSLAAAVVLLAGVVGVSLLLAGRDGEGRNGDDRPTQEFAMAGTDLAPSASAVATNEEWRSGFAITLDITGLPPAGPDSYYQGWVKGPGGLVSIGTFHMRGGDGSVELWSGVDLDRYPTVTVTLQEEGAGPESSGQVVLSGEAP